MKHEYINFKEQCRKLKSFCRVYDVYCLLVGSSLVTLIVVAVMFIVILKVL